MTTIRGDALTTGGIFAMSSSTLTTGNLINLTTTTTGFASGNELLNIATTGVNATNAITVTGMRINIANTNGTSGTNVGADITASGATTNNLQLVLREPAASGTNYTAFKTVAQAADLVLTLPSAYAAVTVCVRSDIKINQCVKPYGYIVIGFSVTEKRLSANSYVIISFSISVCRSVPQTAI